MQTRNRTKLTIALERYDRHFPFFDGTVTPPENVGFNILQVGLTRESSRGWWNDGTREFARYPDLGQLVAGVAPGRQSPEEITCFVNNVGLGLQFAAAGALVLRKAREAGLGHELPEDWFSEDVHP